MREPSLVHGLFQGPQNQQACVPHQHWPSLNSPENFDQSQCMRFIMNKSLRTVWIKLQYNSIMLDSASSPLGVYIF